MYNCCDDTVHFQRRKCSTSPAKGVQPERYIHRSCFQLPQDMRQIFFGGHTET